MIAPPNNFPDGLNREQSVDGRRARSREKVDERERIVARRSDLRLDDALNGHMAVFRCQEAENVTGVVRDPMWVKTIRRGYLSPKEARRQPGTVSPC